MKLKIFVIASCVMLFSACATQNKNTSTGKSESSIGYASVTEAYHDLKSNSDFKETVESDWTIFTNDETKTIWSFSPESHSSYPSAVKRQLVEENNAIYMETNILCKSGRQECESLAKEFKKLN